jgi:TRAP-type C4-dicarboxylate transport system permease small subunit
LRRFLDRLYDGAAAAAALCLAAIAAVMLAQAAMRELGMLLRGADDIVAWLCAATAFLALGHTFRRGELVRIGVLIERLPQAARRKVALAALAIALVFVAYMLYAVTRFVYESWKFKEVAQGLIQIPIWIPQMSFVLGAAVFFIAVLDEFVILVRCGTPAYEAAEADRRARKDFSESL